MNLLNLNDNNNNLIKMDETNIIEELQKYMFTENKIEKSIFKNNSNLILNIQPLEKVNQEYKKEEYKIKEYKKQEYKKQENNDFFFPYEKDSLFWCFYIIKNNKLNYDMIEYKNIIIEKKIKIEYIEKIRKEKQLLKTYKIASLIHIENNLVNEYKTDLKTFLSLCVIEKINIFYIFKNTYFELLMNDTNEHFIVYLIDNKYGYKINTNDEIDSYKKKLFKIDNIEKPIKAITNYKLQELIDFCIKLSIDTINKETKKNKNKKDLYELINNYF